MEQKGNEMHAATAKEGFLQKNLKMVLGACGAVLVLAAAGALGSYLWKERSQKAAEALYPCEQYFVNGQFEKALNGDSLQCSGFAAVADQYGMTKSGNLARLYAGISCVQLGKYEEAKGYLADFDLKSDAMISPAALGALGNTYVELGDVERGAETLVKAAKEADNSVLSPIFLVQAGEAYESLGENDKALKAYEQVRDSYRNSTFGEQIEKYIERVKQ